MPKLVEGSPEEIIKKEPEKQRKTKKTRNIWKILSRIMPTSFDALAILCYGTLFTIFSNFLKDRPVAAVYSFLGLLLLAIIGIYFLKISEPKAKKRPVYATVDLLPAIGFGIFILASLSRIDSEILQNLNLSFLQYDSANTWLSFAVLFFIVLWFVYAAYILIDEFDGTITDGEALHPLAQAFSFVSINVLVIATTVLWETFYLVDAPGTGNISNLIFYVLVFYFFVSSPRLIGLINKFSWPQLVTAVASIGYYIWYLLPRIQ